MKESDGEKKYPTVTIRIDAELAAKVERGKVALQTSNTSKVLKKSLEVGFEVLDLTGWNPQSELIQRAFGGALFAMPDAVIQPKKQKSK
jgi:hypothetical protein